MNNENVFLSKLLGHLEEVVCEELGAGWSVKIGRFVWCTCEHDTMLFGHDYSCKDVPVMQIGIRRNNMAEAYAIEENDHSPLELASMADKAIHHLTQTMLDAKG